MVASLLPFSRSIFRAAADLLLVLRVARDANLVLSDSEVQAIAYFSRIVAHAWHEYETGNRWPLPYEFTFGSHGGPISEDITKAADRFTDLGYIRSSVPRSRADVRLLQLTGHGAQALVQMHGESHDPMHAEDYIAQTCRTGATLSVPGLINAIQREPSLYDARRQGLRAGVPLGNRQAEVVDFIKGLLQSLDGNTAVDSKPWTLVPILLDAFRWLAEGARQ